NINNLGGIKGGIMRVGDKDCALEVYGEDYGIVGENLVGGIEDVRGLESEDRVIERWGKGYGEIGDVFMKLEEEI
ncbi:globin family protein, partial [Staphylococcus epidermidis]